MYKCGYVVLIKKLRNVHRLCLSTLERAVHNVYAFSYLNNTCTSFPYVVPLQTTINLVLM